MYVICQLCGEYKIVNGKRQYMGSLSWADLDWHMRDNHPDAIQVSVRIQKEEKSPN